jgi:Helix-turn-helix domain
MSEPTPSKYPLLEEILSIQGFLLQATYKNKDAARIFGCSVRAIQDRVASGKLASRELIGRARFLSADLEEFLQNSKRVGAKKVDD